MQEYIDVNGNRRIRYYATTTDAWMLMIVSRMLIGAPMQGQYL